MVACLVHCCQSLQPCQSLQWLHVLFTTGCRCFQVCFSILVLLVSVSLCNWAAYAQWCTLFLTSDNLYGQLRWMTLALVAMASIATFTCTCGLGMDTQPLWDAMFTWSMWHAIGLVDAGPPSSPLNPGRTRDGHKTAPRGLCVNGRACTRNNGRQQRINPNATSGNQLALKILLLY